MDEELRVTFTLEEEQPIDCVFKIDATTFDYEALEKKPQINGETLIGNKTSEELHLASSEDIIILEQNIQNEATTRAENDTLLQNNINTLDEKVDGINVNLTQQIEETQEDVNDKYNELVNDIDAEIQARETADTAINQRITDVADELQQTIEENVVALQQEDTALQNQINVHSTTLTAHDTRITNNANAINQEIIDRQNTDDNLQEQIDNLKARGRFLSLWNATTGLAETNPEIDPYPYNTGDYFIVGTVGETNYKPTGTQYVIGQPSTVVETEELASEDVYYFDGQVWHLQVNHGKTVSFGNLAGQPSDNIALKNALDSKVGFTDRAVSLSSGQGNLGVIRLSTPDISGVSVPYDNTYIRILPASEQQIINKTSSSACAKPILPSNLDISIREGLGNNSLTWSDSYKHNARNTIDAQQTLVSGTNIKTINNTSVLGSGNIEIRGASSFAELSGQPTDNANLKTALDNKTQVIIRRWD